ncbi:MAG TPA: hypothetical protein DCS93_24025 [Microscillaceae bacterium]|nr:hypothetical protein [Microscillaceae bacterium]
MKILKTTATTLLLLLVYSTQAQRLIKTTENVHTYALEVKPQTAYALKFTKAFQSISVAYGTGQSLKGAEVRVGEEQFFLEKNSHVRSESQQFSQLLVLAKSENGFQFESGQLSGKIQIHLYNLGNTQAVQRQVQAYKARFRTQQNCGKPASIPQSVWRTGLTPEPIPDPVVTDVKHLIIHHSVSSNSATDQVAILRGIYLYHRATLGWNDIAYNYLIAPDGTLYEGRDPQGKETEGDNIRGGHFCTGRQDGTMGVCLLGTFVDFEPSVPMLKTLIDILTWKVKKDGMDPFGTAPHPLGMPIVNNLPVIAGHQDGCTTLCPGAKVYEKIADIRDKISADVQVCAGKTDHCAALRITGDVYTAVYQLERDFETSLANCKSGNGTGNCTALCSGKSFLDQITTLRSQITAIEQACQNDTQNCVQPCNSQNLLNLLTQLEQQVNSEIQFWLNSTSEVSQEVTLLESEVNQTLANCNTNLEACRAFYPANTFEASITALKAKVDSLQAICQADANASTVNADILRSKLSRLEIKIDQKITELSQQNQLVVYPNPVSNGLLQIRSLAIAQITAIRLKNILGKGFSIRQVVRTSNPFVWQVLLPSLPSGWYLLEMQIDGKWERRRLLLK